MMFLNLGLSAIWAASVLVTIFIFSFLLWKSKKEIDRLKDANFELKNEINLIEERALLKISQTLTEEKKMLYESVEAERLERMAALNKEIEEMRIVRQKELEDLIAAKKESVNAELEKIAAQFAVDADVFRAEIDRLSSKVAEWKEKHDVAIETFKSLDELKNEENYRKLVLTEEEKFEIEELREVVKRLKNPMPFRKAIYDIYFSKKVSDLVNNVVGREKVSGIYKITEIESGRVYVGKSVNIGERWKEHIKRGAGAVPLTQNKLYPAMIEKGIENYTFEVLETTEDVERLGEMERYWQDFFKAREFGYSMR